MRLTGSPQGVSRWPQQRRPPSLYIYIVQRPARTLRPPSKMGLFSLAAAFARVLPMCCGVPFRTVPIRGAVRGGVRVWNTQHIVVQLHTHVAQTFTVSTCRCTVAQDTDAEKQSAVIFITFVFEHTHTANTKMALQCLLGENTSNASAKWLRVNHLDEHVTIEQACCYTTVC